MLRSLRAVGVSLALGAALLAIPAASPSPAIGVGPLPDCRFDDILTVPRGYDDWSVTLVDTMLRVEKTYVPPDLVPVSRAGVSDGGSVRKVAIDDLRAMEQAAEANGTPLGNVSTYRSYRTQVKLFNTYVRGYGYDRAVKFSARPGHSEHQLGLVIDFAAAGAHTFVSEESPTGAWLAANAWRYGWLMSYPKGKYPVTCYTYEPWHYRYVGRDLAAAIHESGLTIREYLWTHHTLVDPVTGEPISTASPSAPGVSTPPTSPSASPTRSSTGGPTAPGASGGTSASPAPPAPAPSITSFGLDTQTLLEAGALVLLLIGLVWTMRMARRPRRRRR